MKWAVWTLRQVGSRGCATLPKEATYFDIVEKARALLTDDDWWVVRFSGEFRGEVPEVDLCGSHGYEYG